MDTKLQVAIIYVIVSVISTIIMFYNANTIRKVTPRYSATRYIYFTFLFAGVSSLAGSFHALVELDIIYNEISSYLLMSISTVAGVLSSLYWVCYSFVKQKNWFVSTKIRTIIFMIPINVVILLIASSPFTHLYFYYENTRYQKGPLFLILSIVLLLYCIVSGLLALTKSFMKEHYVERREYRRLFFYTVAIILIQLLRAIIPILFPYRSVGTMLVFSIFLVQNMKEMIGIDALTHMNNRYAAERFLGGKTKSSDEFEVALLDVDNFKYINDTYGHPEGDKALQYVSEALKQTVPKSCFIARMGGDEFLIVNNNINESILNIEEELNEKIASFVLNNKSEYSFTVSVGYALKENKNKMVPDLLKEADKELYKRKSQKNETD